MKEKGRRVKSTPHDALACGPEAGGKDAWSNVLDTREEGEKGQSLTLSGAARGGEREKGGKGH